MHLKVHEPGGLRLLQRAHGRTGGQGDRAQRGAPLRPGRGGVRCVLGSRFVHHYLSSLSFLFKIICNLLFTVELARFTLCRTRLLIVGDQEGES